jgi:hypothetical protein
MKRLLALAGVSMILWSTQIRADDAVKSPQPSIALTQQLQGSWEGELVGRAAVGKCQLTINRDSLRFQGLDTNDWYETTFTLPLGTQPQQLHATIRKCPHPAHIGKVVYTIVRIEEDTLTMVGIEDDAQDPPDSFDGNEAISKKLPTKPFAIPGLDSSALDGPKSGTDARTFRYLFKKVQLQKKPAETPAAK